MGRLATALILGEIITSILGTIFFMVGFGNPNRIRNPHGRIMAWHLWLFSAFTGLVLASLLLGFGVRPPLWVYVLVFGAMDGVVWWRFALLLKYSPPSPRESSTTPRKVRASMGSIDRINKAVVAGVYAAVGVMLTIVLAAQRAPRSWEWLYILGFGAAALLHTYATPNSDPLPPLPVPPTTVLVESAQRYPRMASPAHSAGDVTQVQPRVPGAPVE